MIILRLISWTPGFVTIRLITLLREYGLGLAEAHIQATRFVEGNEISVCFDVKARADAFSVRAEQLGVKVAASAGIRIAS